MQLNPKEHWNRKFSSEPITQLSWYESRAFPSIQFIEDCKVPKQSPIVDVGSGATTLIPNLLELGYRNLYAVDISEVALEKARSLLKNDQADQVRWVVDDITHPKAILQIENAVIWHDRAMFHFLTEEEDRQTYLSVVKKLLMSGGFVIMAAFALDGADRCSGLPVQRYSAKSLDEFLGKGFKLIESLDYVYRMPGGDIRPYVYTRFQKM